VRRLSDAMTSAIFTDEKDRSIDRSVRETNGALRVGKRSSSVSAAKTLAEDPLSPLCDFARPDIESFKRRSISRFRPLRGLMLY